MTKGYGHFFNQPPHPKQSNRGLFCTREEQCGIREKGLQPLTRPLPSMALDPTTDGPEARETASGEARDRGRTHRAPADAARVLAPLIASTSFR